MITDKGTWVGVGGWVREKMMVFVSVSAIGGSVAMHVESND